MTRPDDFDRYADEQEYKADQAREALKRDHDLFHWDVDDCEFCIAENEQEKE